MLILYLSNEMMSLIVQLSSMVMIIAFSINFPDGLKAKVFGVCLMLLANLTGQLIIAGEGPALLPGCFIFPLYGIIIAHITIAITRIVRNRNKNRSSAHPN